MQQLVLDGKKQVKESDASLLRSEKLVEDTLQIGQQVRGNAQRPACMCYSASGAMGSGMQRAACCGGWPLEGNTAFHRAPGLTRVLDWQQCRPLGQVQCGLTRQSSSSLM